MTSDDPHDDFGCAHCWPASADAAWAARTRLSCDADLIDESHFHVMILACTDCAQRFVSVFTETVDWVDGEDPQAWSVLPITNAEAADLMQRRDGSADAVLGSLGPARRCLRRECPKREPARC